MRARSSRGRVRVGSPWSAKRGTGAFLKRGTPTVLIPDAVRVLSRRGERSHVPVRERKPPHMLQWNTLLKGKVLLTAAALGAVSVVAIGGTYANFTATPTTIASNAFASGALTMSRSGSGAIFTASTMKIGDTATGSVTITNTGNLAGVYTLAGSTSGSSPLAGQLNMKIYKDNDGVVGSKIFDGAL